LVCLSPLLCRELLAKIDEHRAQNSELRKQYDDAQAMHLDLQMKYEREQQAKQQQLDLVSEDLERSMARASALEKEKEGINQQYLDLWKKQYQAQDTGAKADQSAAATATSARVAELETTLVGKEALCKQLQLQVFGAWGLGFGCQSSKPCRASWIPPVFVI
jgi:hypothetical protein